MNDKKIAIRVRNLGKKYTLGGPQEQYHTLRDAIVNSVKAPFKRFHRAPPDEGFWALKDVSFDVEQGEVVGIIGRNGAGKSTLLKILSRITAPTEGTIELYGRVGSLLEVGTGFHPEMTGRENIFLNGAILGMKKTDIEQKFDEIVKFSEIDKFLDTPVKRYSSGMYVRLAFAVAAHMDTEILLVDEVLAVGDAVFQKKCMGKMGDVAAKEGRTVLFVSHNMGAINNLCSRCIFVENGHVLKDGETTEVINHYISVGTENVYEIVQTHNSDLAINLLHAYLENAMGERCSEFRYDEQINLIIKYEVNQPIENCTVWAGIRTNQGIVAFETSDFDIDDYLMKHREPGIYQTTLKIPLKMVNHGAWIVRVGIFQYKVMREFFLGELQMNISDIGTPGQIRTNLRRGGLFQPYLKWETTKIKT